MEGFLMKLLRELRAFISVHILTLSLCTFINGQSAQCGRRRTHCADCPFLNEYKRSKKSKCSILDLYDIRSVHAIAITCDRKITICDTHTVFSR